MSNCNLSLGRCRATILGTSLAAILTGLLPVRTEAAGTLYWSSSGLRRASTDGDCPQFIHPETLGEGVIDVDVDFELGKVYFTKGPFGIHRCDLDGQNDEILRFDIFASPLGIDIDRVNRKLYWTEYGNSPAQNRIMRSNLDGSNVEQLLSGFAYPFGIAIDPDGGKMYWTQGTWETDSGAIHRANLDGTFHEQIITVSGQVPIGIAIHHASSRVFWTDGNSDDAGGVGGIYRANFDGRNVEQILSDLQGLRYLDIDQEVGKLYFGRQVEPADVFSCDLDGGGFVALGLGAAHGIACVPEKFGFECIGDTNEDLDVDVDDLLSVINSWGPCRSCAADSNGDGVVDINDLLFVLDHWTI